MGGSLNGGTPKTTPIFGNTHMFQEDHLIMNYHGWDEKTNEFIIIHELLPFPRTNIPHLGKRKVIFKSAWKKGIWYVSS